MSGARKVAVVIGLLLLPLAVIVGIVTTLRADDDAQPPAPNQPRPAVKTFNGVGMPPIQTDPCPGAGELLTQPASGDDLLPDVTLECIGEVGTTETLSLRRLGGVPTVVNLWATWCTPCRREMPHLQALHAAAGGKLRFLGVNTKDYAEGARATINQTGVRFPSIADPDEKVRIAVGSVGMPVTLFVSADGHIVHRKLGEYRDRQTLADAIAEHLGVRL